MYNQDQIYMNSFYYNAVLSGFKLLDEGKIKVLAEENFGYFISYLTEVIKSLYAYLCGNEFDESFFNSVFNKIKKVNEYVEKDDLGVLYNAIINIGKFSTTVKKYKKTGEKIPHIIFLIGNPGSGKSYIARMLACEDTNIKVIKKYTTRQKRKDEESGVVETQSGVSTEDIIDMKYKFKFTMNDEDNLCAVNEEDIISALKDGKNPVIATTSLELYEQISKDFPCQTHLIRIDSLVLDDTKQEEIFKKQGRTNEEIKNRLGKSTIDDIRKYDYNLRVLLNPITFLKTLSSEEQKSFIYTQLKKIFEQFGANLKLSFKESEYLEDYDETYVTTMFRNINNLYPFLSGRYDEEEKDYLEGIPKK